MKTERKENEYEEAEEKTQVRVMQANNKYVYRWILDLIRTIEKICVTVKGTIQRRDKCMLKKLIAEEKHNNILNSAPMAAIAAAGAAI